MKFKLIVIATLSSLAVSTAFAAIDPKLCRPGVGATAPEPPEDCVTTCFSGTVATDKVMDVSQILKHEQYGYQTYTGLIQQYYAEQFTCVNVNQPVIVRHWAVQHGADAGSYKGHNFIYVDEYFDVAMWSDFPKAYNWWPATATLEYPFDISTTTDIFVNDRYGWWTWRTSITTNVPEVWYMIRVKKPFIGARTVKRKQIFTIYTAIKKYYSLEYLAPIVKRFDVLVEGAVESYQTCQVDGGATIEFGKVSDRALRTAGENVPVGTEAKSGVINISCKNIIAPVKLQLSASKAPKNNALVADGLRNDVGFKIVDEDSKALVPGTPVALPGIASSSAGSTSSTQIKFKAWPVFLGAATDPLPAPGEIQGHVNLEVQFQ